MCLNGTKECLDMRRRLLMFCQPASHGGFICLASVQGPAIYNIFYNGRRVMLVGPDEMWQFRMGMPAVRANPNRYAYAYPKATAQTNQPFPCAVPRQMRLTERAHAFRFI